MSTDEITMPVTRPEALALTEIHAMRALTDAVTRLAGQVERMGDKLDDVKERVVAIEASKYEQQIELAHERLGQALRRIDQLEARQDRQDGAMSVGSWVSKYAPWLMAIIVAGLTALGAGVGG